MLFTIIRRNEKLAAKRSPMFANKWMMTGRRGTELNS